MVVSCGQNSTCALDASDSEVGLVLGVRWRTHLVIALVAFARNDASVATAAAASAPDRLLLVCWADLGKGTLSSGLDSILITGKRGPAIYCVALTSTTNKY